jgi:hypothetical protein
MFVAALVTNGTYFLRAEDMPLLTLGPGDVHKEVILVNKPSEVVLEVTYSKAKQTEFLTASQTGLPKKIRIALNSQVVSERTITRPLTGHSVKIPMPNMDEAFSQALALMPLLKSVPPVSTSVTSSPSVDEPLLSASSGSIEKFAVFMYSPSTVWIDLTLGDKEKAEAIQWKAKSSGGKIRLSLDGRSVGELQLDDTGSSARIFMANVHEAMSVAKSIMIPNGKAD